MADPPWPYPDGFPYAEGNGHSSHKTGVPRPITKRLLPYDSMPLEDIMALPVRRLADPEGCRLFLWTTNAYLPDAFRVMAAWGFKYAQTLIWHKLGAPPFVAHIAPNHAEFLLVGVAGAARRKGTMPSTVIAKGVPKRHSAKPECFIDWIEQTSYPPYVELFSRRHRLGWDTWGLESANTAEWDATSA